MPALHERHPSSSAAAVTSAQRSSHRSAVSRHEEEPRDHRIAAAAGAGNPLGLDAHGRGCCGRRQVAKTAARSPRPERPRFTGSRRAVRSPRRDSGRGGPGSSPRPPRSRRSPAPGPWSSSWAREVGGEGAASSDPGRRAPPRGDLHQPERPRGLLRVALRRSTSGARALGRRRSRPNSWPTSRRSAGDNFANTVLLTELAPDLWSAGCSPPPGWWTHGLPPQSGPVTADTPLSAMPRSTVPAGGTRRARHAVRPKASACRSSRLARGGNTVENAVGRAAAGLAVGHADGRPRSTPGSTSRPTTAAASPGRSPRPPSSGTGSAPPPPARGRRRMADAPSAPGPAVSR